MNWMTPHDIYLNSAQNALHEAVNASGASEFRGHVEHSTNDIGNEPNVAIVTWASVRVVNIEKRIMLRRVTTRATNSKSKLVGITRLAN